MPPAASWMRRRGSSPSASRRSSASSCRTAELRYMASRAPSTRITGTSWPGASSRESEEVVMKRICRVLILLMLGLAGTVLAGSLRRLPNDRPLPQGDGSPGVVTFSHASHVDAGKPDCTTCHPAPVSYTHLTLPTIYSV